MDTLTLAAEYAETIAQDLAQLNQLAAHDSEAAVNWLNEQLEVVRIDRNGELSAVEVLVTYGGPNCRVTVPIDGDVVSVHVAWGSDESLETVYCPVLCELFSELFAV